jgi:hypothetical protein
MITSGAIVQRFSSIGAAAVSANRPSVFSTPDSSEASVMKTRYGMASCAISVAIAIVPGSLT